MIIGGLIALFSMMFGGSEIALFVDNLDKHVKKYVTDDLRKDEALTAIGTYLDNINAHKDRRKGYEKELNAMLIDPLIELRSFEVFMESALLAREEFQVAYVRMRVDISESITDEEWEAIMDAGRDSYKKEMEKKQKGKEAIEKQLDKVQASILAEYTTADSKRAARAILDEFNSVVKQLAKEKAEFNFYDNSELTARVLDYDKYLALIVASNLDRDMVYELFVNTYFDLREIATPEEWPKIAKEYKKYYK